MALRPPQGVPVGSTEGQGEEARGVHPHCTASQKHSAPHGISSWGTLCLGWPWGLRVGGIAYVALRVRGSGLSSSQNPTERPE